MNGFDLIIFALNFKFKFEMKICLRLRREGGRGLVLSCIDCRVLSSREEVVDVEGDSAWWQGLLYAAWGPREESVSHARKR